MNKILKIESADTGNCFNIRIDSTIDSNELNISKLKSQIALFISILPDDQILLVGPPYKRLDSQLSIDLTSIIGQRIFLFNRRVYSDEIFHPIDVKLIPYEIPIPNNNIEFNSKFSQKLLDSSTSPLLKALPDYEKQFLINLKKGECYLLASEQSLQSSRKAVEEHYIQIDASSAAFSNFNDHFNLIEIEYNQTIEKCEIQQKIHLQLLDIFEDELIKLGNYKLHTSLVEAYINNGLQSNNNCYTSKLDLKKVNTLLDCLPLESENEWYRQCQSSHFKVDESLMQLKSIFDRIMIQIKQFAILKINDENENNNNDNNNNNDDNNNNVLVSVIKSMEDKIRIQNDNMARLRDDYRYVCDKLSMVFSDNDSNDKDSNVDFKNDDIVLILSDLENRRKLQELEILIPMESIMTEVMSKKQVIEHSKTSMNKKIYSFMRSLALLQSEMQHNLKKRLKLLKKYIAGHNEYFNHLKNVINLPQAYEKLLLEVIRRKTFNNFFENVVTFESNRIATFRAEETKNRELFMSSYGTNLPPIFFEMIPSLNNKPPFYNPSLTEAQWLPDIKIEDINSNIHEDSEISPEKNSNIKSSESMIFEALDIIDEDTTLKCSQLEYQNAILINKVAELTKKIEQLESNNNIDINVNKRITNEEDISKLIKGYNIIEKLLVDDDNDIDIENDLLLELFPRINGIVSKIKELKANNNNNIIINSNISNSLLQSESFDATSNLKISFRTFGINDIALFIPANASCDKYVAFHKNAPHRFLSEESLLQILRDVPIRSSVPPSPVRKPDYILGKIIFIETRVSSTECNPYDLQIGTEYHAITVERLML